MMFKSLFIFLFAAIILIGNAALSENTTLQEQEGESSVQTQTFVSNDSGYTVEFPEQWEVMKGVMGTDVVALAPKLDPEDLFRENVNIIFTQLEFPITKEEYYGFNLKSLEQLLVDFDLEESTDVQIDGVDARVIVFTHTMAIVNAKVMQYLILDENRAYVMTFTSDPIDFESYRPKFEEITNSFRFKR